MEVCANCGKSVSDGAVFCPECGTLVSLADLAPDSDSQAQQRQLVLNWDRKTCLQALNLVNQDLTEVYLAHADLCHSNLQGANLTGANLQGANLAGTWLQGINLLKANLRRANLSSTHLECASLIGADLREARLIEANLGEADLTEANLEDADLFNASLLGANLWQASLDGAFLLGADFTTARVSETQFQKAWVMCRAIMPDGSLYDGRYCLEGDLNWACCEGHDPEAPDDMARFYGATRQ